MAQKVYLETSVVSYLAARPSRDLLVAGHQQATISWWDLERHRYDVVVSELVIEEARVGNPEAAAKRLDYLKGLDLIEITGDVANLSHELVRGNATPEKANTDALHISICAVHEIDYLLTWNCKHINNPHTRRLIDKICLGAGFTPTIICTPEELSEE